MAFALDLRLPPATELCRVVREECRQAKAHLRRRGSELPESVHEARRALRRVRAALLIVRPGLDADAYAAALAPWREAGRRLCAQRDAQSAIEALGRIDSAEARARLIGELMALPDDDLHPQERISDTIERESRVECHFGTQKWLIRSHCRH